MRDVLGQKAFLDLSDVTSHSLLARDCIAALYEHASPGRVASDHSISSYAKLIRDLLNYCSCVGVPKHFRMCDINTEFLLNYRAHVRLTYADLKSDGRRRLFGNLGRLLQASQAIGLAHPDFVPPRNFRIIRDSDTTQPYTAGEALDIEDACRNHIRLLENRLEEGRRLLAEGRNPRLRPERDAATGRLLPKVSSEKAWNQLPNLLWYVVNCLGGKYLTKGEMQAQGHSSFNNAAGGVWGGEYRRSDIYSYLYPLAEDLIPFIVLLAKTTGRNESSILGLRRDCLSEADGQHCLWYEKARGATRRYKLRVANDGPFSPVALIKTLQRVTEPLVPHAALMEQEKLFLGLTIRGRGLDPVKSLDESYTKYQMNCEGGWCAQNNLFSEHGEPLRISLRKMRVYYLSRKYRAYGQLAKVSRDAAHVLTQTTVGYVNNASTKHIHEQAIEDGIQSALALARPTTLTDDSVRVSAAAIGVNEIEAEKILKGEQDVFFASCRDFYNRPGGQPNTPCDKPWGCLMCSNAIITRHVLPRVLAFKEYMAQQQGYLANEDWMNKFGQAWAVLTGEILPKFSSDALAEAERRMRGDVLYIPLAMKV